MCLRWLVRKWGKLTLTSNDINNILSYSSNITCKHMHSPYPSSSFLPRPLLPSTSPPPLFTTTNTHISSQQKQWFCLTIQRNMVTSSVWRWAMLSQMWSRSVNYILYIPQNLPYMEQHNGQCYVSTTMIVNRNRALCCSVYSNTLVVGITCIMGKLGGTDDY